MYDYAGEWIYRVGIPAKSGVGGGIVAALPSQLGLGTFSPLLDSHGNSVRGLEGMRGAVVAVRPAHAQPQRRRAHLHHRRLRHLGISSRRSRQPHEQQILDERHSEIRVDRTGRRAEIRQRSTTSRGGSPANRRAPHPDPRFPPRARPSPRRGARCWRRISPRLGNGGVTTILAGIEDIGGLERESRADRRMPPEAAALRAAR